MALSISIRARSMHTRRASRRLRPWLRLQSLGQDVMSKLAAEKDATVVT